jgi:type II secretory ATPase GspE/PulE/Tfp pilus assembly ATPase PilB-like protein
MPVLLSAALDYGGYVSWVKLVVYLILFLAWLPLVNWVHTDTQSVRTKTKFWTGIIAGAGGVSLLIWLVAPFFLIGLLIFLIAVGSVSLAYVMHRNSLVAEFEKVMTPQHFKSLFTNDSKKMEKSTMGISFVTANGNDVPLPEPKTYEAYAYQDACEIFEDAVWRRVSQIAFLPAKQEYKVSYTIDGVPVKQPPKEREDMEYFISLLKQIADLDTKEKRKPQTGKMYAVIDGKKIVWELTTAGSTAGEQILVKKFEDKELMIIDDLGMEADQTEALKTVRDRTSGLFLITGPAKDGTSTTFYAIMKNHDPFMNDINTFEKDITATMDNVTQHHYSLNDSNVDSYSEQLQSIIRMGPSIIGVADCEDPEAAKLITNAAANQNRVVHVNFEAASTIKALAKWIKLSGDKAMVVDSLIGISNQRLVRSLCDECNQSYKPNPKLLKKFNIPKDKVKVFYRPGDIEYDKHGKPLLCEKCQGTGYYGRTGIFETIIIDDDLRAKLKAAKTMQDIAMAFGKSKVVGIQQRSLRKVIRGDTSINEIIRELTPAKQKTKAKAKAKPKPKPEQ